MSIELTVFDMQKDSEGTQTFESVAAAKAWLKDRPKFFQVFGVASPDISQEVGDELRACMRALDDDERALRAQLAADAETAARARAKELREAEAEQHRVNMAAADPNRPMEVSYRYNADMSLADVADLREIPAEAREAVLEWIRERNTWVESRAQVVGAATVKVWPGPLPEGESERVIMGNFVPVSSADDDG